MSTSLLEKEEFLEEPKQISELAIPSTKAISKICFQDVSLSYDDRAVLDKVSFSLKPGEMKVILGASGSGKSTLLKLALGLVKPDDGAIFINDCDISQASEEILNQIRRKIGMVFQSGALFNSLTVFENVAFRPRELGWVEGKIDYEVKKVLQFVGLLDSAQLLPDALSGGMRRRVAIARAIVDSPEILFYDEPTSGLDPPTARMICEMAIKLRDINSVTSLFVTHKLDDIEYLSSKYEADSFIAQDIAKDTTQDTSKNAQKELYSNLIKFLVLNEGKIIFDDSPSMLWQSKDPFIRKFLGNRNR
ncbi:MAG: ATP-binding cassette domain-containing protein [Acidobacteria bacterium]|nr:ATP-binding cassette domain-containing protein [Acidobacteriota bacterium]